MTSKEYKKLSFYDKEIQKLSITRLNTRIKKLIVLYENCNDENEKMIIYFKIMLLIFRIGELDPIVCKNNPYRGTYFLSKIKDEVSIRTKYLDFFGLNKND